MFECDNHDPKTILHATYLQSSEFITEDALCKDSRNLFEISFVIKIIRIQIC